MRSRNNLSKFYLFIIVSLILHLAIILFFPFGDFSGIFSSSETQPRNYGRVQYVELKKQKNIQTTTNQEQEQPTSEDNSGKQGARTTPSNSQSNETIPEVVNSQEPAAEVADSRQRRTAPVNKPVPDDQRVEENNTTAAETSKKPPANQSQEKTETTAAAKSRQEQRQNIQEREADSKPEVPENINQEVPEPAAASAPTKEIEKSSARERADSLNTASRSEQLAQKVLDVNQVNSSQPLNNMAVETEAGSSPDSEATQNNKLTEAKTAADSPRPGEQQQLAQTSTDPKQEAIDLNKTTSSIEERQVVTKQADAISSPESRQEHLKDSGPGSPQKKAVEKWQRQPQKQTAAASSGPILAAEPEPHSPPEISSHTKPAPQPAPEPGKLVGISPKPVFPKDLVGRQISGTVKLLASINKNGALEQIEVVGSSQNEIMDRNAKATVKNGWGFKAYQRAYQINIMVKYYLNEKGDTVVEVNLGELQFN